MQEERSVRVGPRVWVWGRVGQPLHGDETLCSAARRGAAHRTGTTRCISRGAGYGWRGRGAWGEGEGRGWDRRGAARRKHNGADTYSTAMTPAGNSVAGAGQHGLVQITVKSCGWIVYEKGGENKRKIGNRNVQRSDVEQCLIGAGLKTSQCNVRAPSAPLPHRTAPTLDTGREAALEVVQVRHHFASLRSATRRVYHPQPQRSSTLTTQHASHSVFRRLGGHLLRRCRGAARRSASHHTQTRCQGRSEGQPSSDPWTDSNSFSVAAARLVSAATAAGRHHHSWCIEGPTIGGAGHPLTRCCPYSNTVDITLRIAGGIVRQRGADDCKSWAIHRWHRCNCDWHPCAACLRTTPAILRLSQK